MKTTRLTTGFYKIEENGRVFFVEDLTLDAGRPQWNISEQIQMPNGAIHRTEAFDAADTLRGAKHLITSIAQTRTT